MEAERAPSARGILAGAAVLAAVCVLYVSGYFLARVSHVLVHFEDWDVHGAVHRIDIGEGVHHMGIAKLLYEPMIVVEERFWTSYGPR